MSAVWRASRAAVRRRKLQTAVIGVVVFLSAATLVVALGLLAAASGPFEQAFAKQSGAHLVAVLDPAKATGAQLSATSGRRGVEAAAGPFGQTVLEFVPSGRADSPAVPLTTVGRADPGGPVDRLNVWAGRWATAAGEIVLNGNPADPPSSPLGSSVRLPGHPALTVVGYAFSVSATADAWVSPGQMADLHPAVAQMLYRFHVSATGAQLAADLAEVTGGLPPGALVGSQSWLAVRDSVQAQAATFVPFLLVFGVLGLVVAVMIVANVVSGAVVAGLRHIGVLKSLGFTPGQVLAVYLTMVSVPAIAGCALGTVLGHALAVPLLEQSFRGFGAGPAGVAPWVDAATLVGLPAVVLLTALLPALRARRVSAVQAISAGSAPRPGRGLRVQRRLSGTRLPRAVSLGLGWPFARPARSFLTMAAVVLGVTSVTFALGLSSTLTRFGNADPAHHSTGAQAVLMPGDQRSAQDASRPGDAATEALLRSLPGAVRVIPSATVDVHLLGSTQPAAGFFHRGDAGPLGYRAEVLRGRWYDGPGEIVAPAMFLHQRGLSLGDSLTLDAGGRQTRVTIVGEVLAGSAIPFFADWSTLGRLAPDTRADRYDVLLAPGAGVRGYLDAARAADPGLQGAPAPSTSSFNLLIIGVSSLLTLLLGTVAALGVLNTVLLDTRERRRDLGLLKSIGMTPRQVTAMVVTSMAALGAVGSLLGIPLGVLAHRLVLAAMEDSSGLALPPAMKNVWHPSALILLTLAGVAIAALGALLPARSAARLTIAQVLHNE